MQIEIKTIFFKNLIINYFNQQDNLQPNLSFKIKCVKESIFKYCINIHIDGSGSFLSCWYQAIKPILELFESNVYFDKG